ncbi:MAG TPA: c-type cytochrome [Gemmatimonadales bacterium]|nr:c-type cytochrome [Gemmatimonadales bacterium]
MITACGRSSDSGGGGASGAPPSIRYDQHVFAGGVAPPAGSLTNPLQGDRSSAAEGERIFAAMNCDGCHGGGATGWVGPSLVDGRWRYGGSDGAVFQSIYYGRPRGMPAYGGILSPSAIWKIVTYLRAQPVPADVPTESWLGRRANAVPVPPR